MLALVAGLRHHSRSYQVVLQHARWAAAAHTANAPDLTVSNPAGPSVAFPSVGSYLHRWYGNRYRSVDFTFDHGTRHGPIAMAAPRPSWFEHPLGSDRPRPLHARPAPPPERRRT